MRIQQNRITRVTGDFALSILASVIYTFARQIVVFPLLAARLPENGYGTLLTVVGLAYVCSTLLGGSLNNIRLVQNSRYEEQEVCGDFNVLRCGWLYPVGYFFPNFMANVPTVLADVGAAGSPSL